MELFLAEHKKLWSRKNVRVSVFICFVYMVVFAGILQFQWFTFGSRNDFTSVFGNNFDGYDVIRERQGYSEKYGHLLTDDTLAEMVSDYQYANEYGTVSDTRKMDWSVISTWLETLYPEQKKTLENSGIIFYNITYYYKNIRRKVMSENTQKARMSTGELYEPTDPEAARLQAQCLLLQNEYNVTSPLDTEKRQELLTKMFKKIGKGCYIEPPLHANWAGRFCTFGDYVYVNFNLTMVDDGEIVVGSHVMFGPNVTLTTAGHPVQPNLRYYGIQSNQPIHIEDNVWIGANVVILPGVTIGKNSVIGAGSVVTKDIPANVVAVGVPCRLLRPISDRDDIYYFRDKKIDWNDWTDPRYHRDH